MPQFVIRDGSIADLDGLYTVAEHLDSVNLPHDRQVGVAGPREPSIPAAPTSARSSRP